MAKFEANIPSYLKSGAGSVPIDNNFAKIDSEPENLSQVIDNYTNNFSGLIKSPDDMGMSIPPVEIPQIQPQVQTSDIFGIGGETVIPKIGKKINEKSLSLSTLITDDEGNVHTILQYLRKFGEDAFFGGQKNPDLPENFYNKLGDKYMGEMKQLKESRANDSNKDINPLDLESIIKPSIQDVDKLPGESKQREPTIPSDVDIEDILVA